MEKNKKDKFKCLLKVNFCFVLLFTLFLLPQYANKSYATEKQRIFLSDIPYDSDKIEEKSSVGWGSITMDKNLDASKNNGLISLIVDNKPKTFLKGISAHANSQVIFEVEDLVTQGFTKFSTYYGVDAGRGSVGTTVAFKITYKTEADSPWQEALPLTDYSYKGNTPAGFIEIDLTGKKFIKLEAYGRRNIDSAHACYGNAQVCKPGFTGEDTRADFVKTVEEYDEIIKRHYGEEITGEYEIALLQRELVNILGYDLLQEYVALDPDNLNVVRWLMTDIHNLKPFLAGGKPEGGSYFKAIDILSELYKQRGEDLNDTTEISTTRESSTLSEMYKTMMFSVALTHSGTVYFWNNRADVSDPIERYDIYKRLYHGKVVADDRTTKGIGNDLIEKEKFASLHVEEMRWIMNTVIDNESIEWLNWYAREVKNGALGPYSYQRYTGSYNYNKDIYYSEENREMWTEKYNLLNDKWNVPYGKKKMWIVFEEGSVCGGMSKNACCIYGAFKGLPNTCASQPGHCAYLYYEVRNGKGWWGVGNNISGWAQSGKTEHLGVRIMNDWGNTASGWTASYMVLAQEALNDYETYEKAEVQLMLAKVYEDNPEKLEEIYRKALEIEDINYDALEGLVNLYLADETKTEDDFYELAKTITTTLKYHPKPMCVLLEKIQPKFTTALGIAKFDDIRVETLQEATKCTAQEHIQDQATRQVSSFLLGNYNNTIATFSFDGENAGKIVLDPKFQDSSLEWNYSLDGKQTWTSTEEHVHQLSNEEIASIKAENDIYIYITGASRADEDLYKIDILDNVITDSMYYGNDLENRVIGVNLTCEWRNSENDPWTSYEVASPDNTGNKTLQIRQRPTGTKLASNILTFTFTEDNQPDTRKYIRIANLAIESYSTQSKDNKRPYFASNVIDGNLNTLWHTDFAQNVLQQEIKPFVTIKLDKPRYLSALEFIQRKYPGKPNDPDDIKNARVYVSEDGENWTEAGKIEECATYGELYDITFSESVYGQYVKIEMETKNIFSSLAMVNLFEDTTKSEDNTSKVEILYSTQEITNQPVYARLVNSGAEITITNNDGKDTYVFTENGEFTFEFIDEKGNKGSITAVVNWIDKQAPSVDINYGLDNDKKLFIVLDNISKDVYMLDENDNKINYIEVDESSKKITNLTYLDNSGNAYKMLDKDVNGNTTKITYKNTLKNLTEEASKVEKYITTLKTVEDENKEIKMGEVINEEYFDSEGNVITNLTETEKEEIRKLQQIARSNPLEQALETSGEYEFKLVDKSGNRLYKSIKVDYTNNNTIIASDISYDITNLTNTNVVATINPYIIDTSGKNVSVEMVNNDKNKTYTFEKNGNFTFEYKDSLDTEGNEIKQHTAVVDWIDKVVPTAEVKYTTIEGTNKQVVATLVNESEEITIINNGASREYTFKENGEFTFRFIDKAGNEGTATAKVTNIENENPTPERIKGDTDGDGEITINDLAQVKLHLIGGNLLEGTDFTAADVDGDGEITINDLAKIKLIIVTNKKESN